MLLGRQKSAKKLGDLLVNNVPIFGLCASRLAMPQRAGFAYAYDVACPETTSKGERPNGEFVAASYRIDLTKKQGYIAILNDLLYSHFN